MPSPSELGELLKESYWGNNYLANLADHYGLEAVRERFLKSHADARPNVRRGDFGEAVTAEYLKTVENYRIPVTKLRYKIIGNQTLPGTDCVGLKLSGGKLVEVAYVESKFRASPDTSIAVAGAKQLQQDANSKTPEILTFIARLLRTANDPLADLVEGYIFERDVGLDKCLLVILYEKAIWSEKILINLQDANLELDPLHVYVARIANLEQLSDATFSGIGVEVMEDDH